MLYLRGYDALSHFRIERLLAEISYEVPAVNNLFSQFIYFVDLLQPLTEEQTRELSKIVHPNPLETSEDEFSGELVLVVPLEGMITPWSIRATNLAQACGLTTVKRIERGIAFYIEAGEKLTWGDVQAISKFLMDPLRERVLFQLSEAENIFRSVPPEPTEFIDILQGGLASLSKANTRLKLGLKKEILEILLKKYQEMNQNISDVELLMFSKIKAANARQQVMHCQWMIDGIFKPQSLMGMIKNTYQHKKVEFISEDAAATLFHGPGHSFLPNPTSFDYEYHTEKMYTAFSTETRNNLTSFYPYEGGGICLSREIRKETCVGQGAKSKAGLTGIAVSNLRIPGFLQPWEEENDGSQRFASALDIALQASKGAAQFANEWGRPTICGYFRSFEQKISGTEGQLRGFHKPIMFSAGLGNIAESQVIPKKLTSGMIMVLLGGSAMLNRTLKVHSSLSVSTSSLSMMDQRLQCDLPRANAEIECRAKDVINACSALHNDNPIQWLQEGGNNGLDRIIPQMLWTHQLGAYIELRDILTTDLNLSAQALWCDQVEERYFLVLEKEKLPLFKDIALREAAPFSVIGELTDDKRLQCHDRLYNNFPVNIPLSFLFESTPLKRREAVRFPVDLKVFDLDKIELYDAVTRLLKLPTIADKSFLITICDRTVGGLVTRDQMVGPWQVPVADCAVTAANFEDYHGEAMSLGERPALALIQAEASVRMALGEAITNIAAANIAALSEIRLTANWMAASEDPQEALHLYEAVKTLSMELCPALDLSILAGAHSLSMQSQDTHNELEKTYKSPMTVVIAAFAPVSDVRRCLTPELSIVGETQLILIDLSFGRQRLGGSALLYVYSELGGSCPDVEDPARLKLFFNCVQQLNLEDKILAYHDRSDGGLFITLCEMIFSSHIGLQIDISGLGFDVRSILFNEELGAVIQVRTEDLEGVLLRFSELGLTHCHSIGTLDNNQALTIIYEEEVVFTAERSLLQALWSETSYHLQSLRDNPRTAKKLYETLKDSDDPGLNVDLTFDIHEDITAPFINTQIKPKIAIVREQGITGQFEMAAAFHRAGFQPVDVHMNDFILNQIDLKAFKGMAVCGGFSFGDVLGAGQGWANRILFDSQMAAQFSEFFNRSDTFTLGVGNGCQMLSGLKSLIPGADLWPNFLRNSSEQFESRLCLVEITPSPSILLEGMSDSRILIPVAHGEGRAEFINEEAQQKAIHQHLVALRYVDSRGRKTKVYPANPNGSPLGITALTTTDGRATIMMPHPERAFRTVQYSWHPKDWPDDAPWLRLFRNARLFV